MNMFALAPPAPIEARLVASLVILTLSAWLIRGIVGGPLSLTSKVVATVLTVAVISLMNATPPVNHNLFVDRALLDVMVVAVIAAVCLRPVRSSDTATAKPGRALPQVTQLAECRVGA